MNDVEIESLLQGAGYQYDLGAGGYAFGDTDEADFFGTEEIADSLEIPLDDLIRWEAEQRHADEIAGS
jgi:hypothetical protein